MPKKHLKLRDRERVCSGIWFPYSKRQMDYSMDRRKTPANIKFIAKVAAAHDHIALSTGSQTVRDMCS
jgi:hypothetical protein